MMPLTSHNRATLSITGLSHTGAVRAENEDAICWWNELDESVHFGVLVDGMGGHKGGALASEISINTIRSFIHSAFKNPAIINFSSGSDQSSDDSLDDNCDPNVKQLKSIMAAATRAANEAIQQARAEQSEFKEMGTTLVFVAIWNGNLIVLHTGDSRCYLLPKPSKTQSSKTDKPKYMQLTRDDSVVQSMLDEGVITLEDVPNIPYRNRLTNALGINSTLAYSISSHRFSEEDSLLICSDGFYQAVAMEDACEVVQAQGATQTAVDQLIGMSLDNHTDDNTSVILMGFDARADEVQPAQPATT
jgi:PPM family protein phosphatase